MRCKLFFYFICFFSFNAFSFDDYHVDGFRDLEFGESVNSVILKTKKYCNLEKHFEKNNQLQYSCNNYIFLNKSFSFYAIFRKDKLSIIQLSSPNGRNYYMDVLAHKYTEKYGEPLGVPDKKMAFLEFKDGVSILLGGNNNEELLFISYKSKSQIEREILCANNPAKCPK